MNTNKYVYWVLVVLFVLPALTASGQYEEITINQSNTVIDGDGGLFNDGKITYVIIASKKTSSGWIQTQNVTIQNCTIRGGIRILGLGRNGQASGVKESSFSLGHTERAQTAAPTFVTLKNIVFEASEGLTPLYLAPGTTHVTIENCSFEGVSTGSGPILYMDAESAYNTIKNNHFNMTSTREVIACDGSAHNLIEGNNFELIKKGGIYLYRNCGEGGSVRHQTPSYNIIRYNTFNLKKLTLFHYGIWLGSRNGNRNYCDDDAGYPFGSSIDNRDFADNNIVFSNTFNGSTSLWRIKDSGSNNSINTISGESMVKELDDIIQVRNKVIVIHNLWDDVRVRVYDLVGKEVGSIYSRERKIEFSELPSGVYVISLMFKDKVLNKKILIQ